MNVFLPFGLWSTPNTGSAFFSPFHLYLMFCKYFFYFGARTLNFSITIFNQGSLQLSLHISVRIHCRGLLLHINFFLKLNQHHWKVYYFLNLSLDLNKTITNTIFPRLSFLSKKSYLREENVVEEWRKICKLQDPYQQAAHAAKIVNDNLVKWTSSEDNKRLKVRRDLKGSPIQGSMIITAGLITTMFFNTSSPRTSHQKVHTPLFSIMYKGTCHHDVKFIGMHCSVLFSVQISITLYTGWFRLTRVLGGYLF